jgi:transposase
VPNKADALPLDLAAAHAMILAERTARLAAESERDQSRGSASSAQAFVAYLKLEIEKLKRALFGVSSERKQRLLDQLELQLEDAEASARGRTGGGAIDAVCPSQALRTQAAVAKAVSRASAA